MRNKIIASLLAVAALAGLAACGSDDADVASENISKAADNFEVDRRIVMFNGITDEVLLEITGNCAIEDEGSQLEVTCKIDDDAYRKHFLGLSDNVSYVVEQGDPIDVSENHYRVTFKPQSLIPDPDFQGDTEDTPLSEENQQD